MAEPRSVYVESRLENRLRHGEVLCSVWERRVSLDEVEPEALNVESFEPPWAIIVTQDGDLEQDAGARGMVAPANATEEELSKFLKKQNNGLISSVLVVVAQEAKTVKSGIGGSDIWKRVHQNKDERYQFIAPAGASQDLEKTGFDSLVLDFKRMFSVPHDQLLRDIAARRTRRRGVLTSPYSEHLALRAGYFLQRIPLPVDHHDIAPPQAAALPGPAAPGLPGPAPTGGSQDER